MIGRVVGADRRFRSRPLCVHESAVPATGHAVRHQAGRPATRNARSSCTGSHIVAPPLVCLDINHFVHVARPLVVIGVSGPPQVATTMQMWRSLRLCGHGPVAGNLLDADYVISQNNTEHNPGPSPSGPALLSGAPTSPISTRYSRSVQKAQTPQTANTEQSRAFGNDDPQTFGNCPPEIVFAS